MKTAQTLLVVVLLTGCGATSNVRIETTVLDSTSFTFCDERPNDKRLARVDSSVAGANIYYGDDNLVPPAPTLMKTWLQKAMGSELSGKVVRLSQFTVNVYEPVVASVDPNRLNTAAASVPGGYAAAPLAAALIYGIESIKSEKIVYVKIEGDIEGKEFSVVASELFRGRVSEDNVHYTLVKGLDRMVSLLKADMQSK